MFNPIYDHVPMERDSKYSLVNTGFYKEDDNISHNDKYRNIISIKGDKIYDKLVRNVVNLVQLD